MSIVVNSTTRIAIVGGKTAISAAKRMTEFNYLTKTPISVAALINPSDAGKLIEVTYGNQYVDIPVFAKISEAVKAIPELNTALIYVGAERAYDAAAECINSKPIQLISMITEGLPERDAKMLIKLAKKKNKLLNGPSSVGILSAGECRLGMIGGDYRNMKLCKLYRPGSFGIITKSGGLANELIWMCAQYGDGITTALSIGGDTYPFTDFVPYLEKFEEDPSTHAVIIVGEIGGEAEVHAAEWFAEKPRRIKLIGAVAGTCQEVLPKGMKFGHAGAKEGKAGIGTARFKIESLRNSGALVPDTFGGLGNVIKETYQALLNEGKIQPALSVPDAALPALPKQVQDFVRSGEVLIDPIIRTTLTDDRGEEPIYRGYAASELVDKGYGIEHVVSLLWNKKLPSKDESELIKRIIVLSADHGAAVSGASAAIIAACAGIPMAQSVGTGVSMIGPRFGGAISDAGKYFRKGVAEFPEDIPGFLQWMKSNVGPVPGIGHRVKSVKNPDRRVKSMVEFVQARPHLHSTHLRYALEIEKVTTAKSDKLILNLDGAIAAILTDMGYEPHVLNGFFVLARTIGLIGHWIDQNEQSSKLIRMHDYLINYATPPREEVPPLE
ncbi:MAG: citrate/2-methylcitrate synthase [Chloroherpetonaceae bacterium]|nr:citrate/2-methylcitrate synthase [Chloroherpetonaceae bacterium]